MSGQRLSLAKGLNAGLRRAMERDPKVVLMGEDVGKLGGVFRITEGLQKDFGEHRVLDTPLAESGIVGTAVATALAGIIADSMNTGTVLAGKQLTKDQRHDWLAKFGIGRRTGIEFPNEAQGLLAAADDWDVRQQYTVLFGQGVSQSLLQTVIAYQALANDGIQLTPRLADSVTDAEGVAQPRPTPEGRRIVSADTAKKLRQIMETVITGGHAPDAAVEGWRVGGKTGSANKLVGGRYDPSLPLALTIARLFGAAIEEVFEPDPD